ncbi:MAG: hypothetical protein ACTSQY_01740 [Candidatus Odinarchaeia archaeon]
MVYEEFMDIVIIISIPLMIFASFYFIHKIYGKKSQMSEKTFYASIILGSAGALYATTSILSLQTISSTLSTQVQNVLLVLIILIVFIPLLLFTFMIRDRIKTGIILSAIIVIAVIIHFIINVFVVSTPSSNPIIPIIPIAIIGAIPLITISLELKRSRTLIIEYVFAIILTIYLRGILIFVPIPEINEFASLFYIPIVALYMGLYLSIFKKPLFAIGTTIVSGTVLIGISATVLAISYLNIDLATYFLVEVFIVFTLTLSTMYFLEDFITSRSRPSGYFFTAFLSLSIFFIVEIFYTMTYEILGVLILALDVFIVAIGAFAILMIIASSLILIGNTATIDIFKIAGASLFTFMVVTYATQIITIVALGFILIGIISVAIALFAYIGYKTRKAGLQTVSTRFTLYTIAFIIIGAGYFLPGIIPYAITAIIMFIGALILIIASPLTRGKLSVPQRMRAFLKGDKS